MLEDEEQDWPITGTKDRVLQMIRQRPGTTRTALARELHLSKSTVAHVVGALLGEGRAREGDTAPRRESGSGRPARQLFGGAAPFPVAGVDFGHQHVSVAVADPFGQILEVQRREMYVDLDATTAMDAAASMLGALQDRHQIRRFASIVAGVPGPVARADGTVLSPTILSGWVGLRPALEMGRRLRAPVRIENDATLGAVGEHTAGAGVGHEELLYVKVSDGIGASLILGGEVYRGAGGLAGEIGHTQLYQGTEPCRCGRRGCLEAEVSTGTLLKQLRYTHPGLHIGSLGDLPVDTVTARVFEDAGRTVGRVLSDMCNLINPSAIVVGGRLGGAHPAFIDGVKSAIARFALPSSAAAVVISGAHLGDTAELHGAVNLAYVSAMV